MSRLRAVFRHLPRFALATLFLLPLFWMFTASLRQPGLPPPRTVEWWPAAPHWDNYVTIFRIIPMARYVLNSAIVVAIAVPITLLTASTAGFSLSQLDDSRRRRILTISVVLLMIPGASVWLFRFQILRWLNLIDSLWSLIIPAFAAGNPLFVLLFFWTYRRVPGEIFEAAQLDGAGAISTWWRIARPLARPTAAGVILLAFAAYWSDFASPILYIYRPDLYTLPVGLQILKQIDATNWPLLLAAAVVATAPVIVLFVSIQRAFLDNLSLSSLVEEP